MRSTMLFLAMLLSMSAAAFAQTPVERFEPNNGMIVLLRPVEGADRVAIVTLFAIGNDHDPNGFSGMAHLIEHLYITAAAGSAEARAADEFMKRYSDGWNAQTGDDFTIVATVFKKGDLGEELGDAAARMSGLKVTDADLSREVPRMLAELENMYGGITALAARNHARQRICPDPPGTRRGGVPEQIKAIAIREVQGRLEAYYKPCNATLVLAGGFNAKEVKELVQRHFGGIKAGQAAPAPRAPHPPEEFKTAEIAVKPRHPGQSAQFRLAYAAPSPSSPRYAPFLILVQRMWAMSSAGGKPGSVTVDFPLLDDPRVIFIGGPTSNESAVVAVERVQKFIADAAAPKLEMREAQGARAAMAFSLGTEDIPDSLAKRDLYGLAFGIGRRHQLGIDGIKLRKALEAVTDEGLKQAAKEVFAPEKGAAAIVRPRD